MKILGPAPIAALVVSFGIVFGLGSLISSAETPPKSESNPTTTVPTPQAPDNVFKWPVYDHDDGGGQHHPKGGQGGHPSEGAG